MTSDTIVHPSSYKETLDQRPNMKHGKGCGCNESPVEGICCTLDCLVQPQFYCGQLLTDQSLSRIIEWTQDKLRLARYRDGWGVVCGLQVTCHSEKPGAVLVHPGYAVSCCGDDIILCETNCLDLSDKCRTEDDPCEQIYPEGKQSKTESSTVRIGPCAYEPDRIKVIDLFAHYDEEDADPEVVLVRSSCHDGRHCDYGSKNEIARIVARDGVRLETLMNNGADEWASGYTDCHTEILSQFQDDFPDIWNGKVSRKKPNDETLKELRRWFYTRISGKGQHHNSFCFLKACICDENTDLLPSATQLLFWIIQDCRNAYLSCSCHSCPSDLGVPLARVWLLKDTDECGRLICRVLLIDEYPPFRRPIGNTCWPAPLGCINLGDLIWKRWEEACVELTKRGLTPTPKKYELPGTPAELSRYFASGPGDPPIIGCTSDVTAILFDGGELLGKRVIGFAGQPCPGLQESHGPEDKGKQKAESPRQASPKRPRRSGAASLQS